MTPLMIAAALLLGLPTLLATAVAVGHPDATRRRDAREVLEVLRSRSKLQLPRLPLTPAPERRGNLTDEPLGDWSSSELSPQ